MIRPAHAFIALALSAHADVKTEAAGGLVVVTDNPDQPIVTIRCRKPDDLIFRALSPDGKSVTEVRCPGETIEDLPRPRDVPL